MSNKYNRLLATAFELELFDVCEWLLQEGRADVNARTNGGWTLLQDAAANGHEKIVRLLLDKGASPSLKTEIVEKTPLEIAEIYGRKEVMRILEQWEGGRHVNA